MIKYLKLTNGDGIIGNEISEMLGISNYITLEDVLKVDIDQPTGRFILTSYIPFLELQKIKFNKSNVITSVNLDETLVQYYNLSLNIVKELQQITRKSIESSIANMEKFIENKPESNEDDSRTILPINIHDGSDTIN